MVSASALRLRIESALAPEIPSALTPHPRLDRPTVLTGIPEVDRLAGLPLGAISEIAGPECSGRTSLALSFVAGMTRAGRVCAWVDVADALSPESAAAAGVALDSLLWVRCGAQPAREERRLRAKKPWDRMDQALRATDLLLQAGGFSALVLDIGGIASEFASRVPLATWFRWRAAVEQSQASLVLLAQHPCAGSSAGLVLRLEPGPALLEEAAVLAGMEHRLEPERRRFAGPARKPPQSVTAAAWQSRTPWTGTR